MSAEISYKGKNYVAQPHENVLDTLLRHGQNIPHACKVGTCQDCLMLAENGSPGDTAQDGLRDTLKARNFFLACRCVPTQNLKVSLPAINDTAIKSEIIGKDYIGHNIVSLHIKTSEPFSCRAGQYVSLLRPGTVEARSYSVANLTQTDGYIEIHIRKSREGYTSAWAYDEAKKGDTVYIRGPTGHCFYVPPESKDTNFPLLLAGTGTGLSPLYGVLIDALAYGHQGPIHILHGALEKRDLYYVEKLIALTKQHKNLTYVPCVLNMAESEEGYYAGTLDSCALHILKNLDKMNLRAYFCGAPEMVNSLKKQSFLTGIASKNIFSDPFFRAVKTDFGVE